MEGNGKHISNIISIKSDENIIGSVPVYDFEKEEYITIFTKLGMIKRTKISEYKVTRYSKPMMSIKLKDNDNVASISYGNDSNIIIATSEGYGLWYKSDEVPVIGTKGSGVKSISLKDNDYVVSGNVFKEVDYLVVITDKGTGKRIRINDLEPTTRARRGVLIVREVKTNPHKVLKTFAISSKSNIGIKTSKDIITFKVSEFTIMDRYSTGSSISKTKIKDAFEIALLQGKNDLKDDQKEVEEDSKSNDAYKQLSLLDVDDNLKQVDSLLSNVNDNL